MTVLRRGSKGESVARLQLLLRSALEPPQAIVVDSDFGPATEAAVKQFQAQWFLEVDGVVGPQTWLFLGQKHTTVTPPIQPDVDLEKKATTPKPWMEIAEAELGVSENKTPGQHHSRIVAYHATTTLKATADETPWCSSFVNWVMEEAGYDGTDSALAKSWQTWGTGIVSPVHGAITVIRNTTAKDDPVTGSRTGYHVGFYVSKTATTVKILGGNQSDQVKYSNFYMPPYEIIAYRLPA